MQARSRFATTFGVGPILACTGLLMACTGLLEPGPGSGAGQPAIGPGAGAPAMPSDSTTPGAIFGAAPASLKRLRLVEYQNAIRALLGDAVTLPTELDGDLARGGYTTISAAIDPYASSGIERFESAAYALSAQVFGSPVADALIGCKPVDGADPCILAFIQNFGRRAWRRPLTNEEVTKWTGTVASVAAIFDGDVAKGLEYALAGLLQSPHFLYRVDIGEQVLDSPNQRLYTGYEMAARLSFVLWQTTPDDALLDAARAGELASPEGFSQRAQSMLADARAKPAMQRFFSEFLRLSDLTTQFHPKDAALFPSVSNALYGSMQTEQMLGVADLLDTGSNVLDLLTSRMTYMDSALADFYGAPRPTGTGFSRVPLPAGRRGYLTSGAFLSITAHAASTSPTRRGVYVIQNLLCRSIPAPPPNVNTTLPADTGTTTTRQRLEAHRENPACAACHELFDPVGVSFEHYDAIGAYRETENGLAIDASGALDDVAFDGPEALAALLHASDEVARCLVAGSYRYNTAHNVENEADGEGFVIDELASAFRASGNSYSKLLASMVEHPAFRYAVGQY